MKRYYTFDVLIIGAGQAGLATGYFLAKKAVNFAIIEKNEKIGDNWRFRWDSLKLFSPSEYNNLPGKPFPKGPGLFPTKDEVANYLEYYAEEFKLPVLTGTSAESLGVENSTFAITTNRGIYRARQVVIATGAFQTPYIPSFSTNLTDKVYQVHSSRYKNPSQLPEGDILVVGTGNSGVQIALETSKLRDRVYLSGRKMPSLPRRFLGKDVYWWYYKLRFATATLDSFIGKWLYRREQNKGEPLLGISMKDVLESRKIVHVPSVKAVKNDMIILEDNQDLQVRNIIWATGFRNDYSWINLDVLDKQGKPLHKRGVATKIRGLYFIGLNWLYRANSSNIGGVGRDAEYIASEIIQNR
ncbi:MAG: flavin-containing monooxygenase [Candidatus Odinarchaeota archaeon]